jgi:hypothetical protein
MKLTIELINAKWHVNEKPFEKMSFSEREILGKFIAEMYKDFINQNPNNYDLGEKIRKQWAK